ncbi:MAG TPA: hypothetical protein VH877_15235 [Polyangia bacterium]|nr:hypothetical protein [Polyangia bacterium]
MLAWQAALQGHPKRHLVTADFLTDACFGPASPVDVLRQFDWTPVTFQEHRRRRREVEERMIALPDLVVELAGGPAADERLIEMVRFGFQDALRPACLLRLARRYGGVTGLEPERCLVAAERIAGDSLHPGIVVARFRLGAMYGSSIFQAWETLAAGPDGDAPLTETRFTEAECTALLVGLLERADALDKLPSHSVRERLLESVATCTLGRPRLSLLPGEDGVGVRLTPTSLTGRLWNTLGSWAGTSGPRRAALERALRRVLCLVDQNTGAEGPAEMQVAPLLLTLFNVPRARDLGPYLEPGVEAVAILSAGWRERPLRRHMLTARTVGDAPPRSIDMEALLQEGAIWLGQPGIELQGDEAAWGIPPPESHESEQKRFAAPPEAVLLRAPPDTLRRWAPELARLLGPHDGTSYHRWLGLAESPEDGALRREAAREAVRAIWRLVREDSTLITRWGRDPLLLPDSIGSLRQLLSEPDGSLPEQDIHTVLLARMKDGAAWASRTDQWELVAQVSQVPGTLMASVTRGRLLAEDYGDEVARAGHRLEHPHDEPAARLGADILFMRVAASHQPLVPLPGGVIDLRQNLPAWIETTLQALAARPRPDSLGEAEPALLRICGVAVEQLAGDEGISIRDGLWLTYRLYQWLGAQLEALSPAGYLEALRSLRALAPKPLPPGRGVQHPLHRFWLAGDQDDHRLATVLFALATMEELEQTLSRELGRPMVLRAVYSESLAALLLDLAAREPTPAMRRLRFFADGPASLGWVGPAAVPDLALLALLSMDPAALARLPDGARQRWLERLQGSAGEEGGLFPLLEARIFESARHVVHQLTAVERRLLKERALLPTQDPNVAPWRKLLLAALLGAGELDLLDEMRGLVDEHLGEPLGPLLFADYLVALSFVALDRLDTEAERLLGQVPDPMPFAYLLGQVALVGSAPGKEHARRILARLVQKAPFQDNERMRQLFGLLGIG